jgi:hypothetical protein
MPAGSGVINRAGMRLAAKYNCGPGAAMMQMGKLIVVFGIILVVVGAVVWGLGRVGFRGLPGDIHIETPNTRFYFPLVSCLLLSAVLTGLLWLWRWMKGS